MSILWKYAKRGFRIMVGRVPAGRRLNVFPDDVFLVSYPRSGNTWTRFLIGNLVNPEDPVTFANIEARIPEIYLFADRVLRRLPRPRILKSHEYFDHRYKRVIYIVRDPRDIATSMYHYSIKRRDIPDDYPIEQFVPRFINGEFLEDFGTWHEHASSWLAARQNQPGFVLLRYEEMLVDAERELIKAARLLRVNVTGDMIARAVQLSSAARMRELENRQAEAWKLTREARQDKPFVRAARSGSWRSDLPSRSVQEIERAWGVLMQELGYELSHPSAMVEDKPAFVPS
jgi:sulfotransferase family protein